MNKTLNVALRQCYPGAFVSYRGTVFKVKSSNNDDVLSGVTPDKMWTHKANDIISEHPNLMNKVFDIINEEISEHVGIYLPDNDEYNLEILVPGKIRLEIDDTLDRFYCQNSKCGTIWKLKWLRRNFNGPGIPNCRICGHVVSQAPIFFPFKDNSTTLTIGVAGSSPQADIQPMSNPQLYCHYKYKSQCKSPDSLDHKCVDDFIGTLGSLTQLDPTQPKESLTLCNPNCPKKLSVPEKPIERPRPHGQYRFWRDFPRTTLNHPLTAVAVSSYDDDDDLEIKEINMNIRSILPKFLNSDIIDHNNTKFTNMRILETVYGYVLGRNASGSRITYVNTDHKTIIGRVTNTKGLEITIKKTVYENIKKINNSVDNNVILKIILHSFKHALLVEAPILTGLDENMFHGAYEINRGNADWAAKIYVYDVEDGSSGALSTIMRNKIILKKMLYNIHHTRLHCKIRECTHACKYCLYIRNCGSVNKKLNRHLLLKSGIFKNDDLEEWDLS